MKARSRKPTLVANPAADEVFAGFAQLLVDHGARSVEELERRLRTSYPQAVVHARELAGEGILIWYVYRDGHWVGSSGVPTVGLNGDAHGFSR
jgi:hypothetical protein